SFPPTSSRDGARRWLRGGRREAAVVALIAALLAQGGGLEVAEVVVVAVSGAASLFIGKERRWSAMAAEVVGQRARRGGFNGVGAGWVSWSDASIEGDGVQGERWR